MFMSIFQQLTVLDIILFDVETVNKCRSRVKLGKAAGVDAIETEYLINAHPLVVILLCSLFNILLSHGTVPRVFLCGVIVPVLKDRNGDVSSIKNYRGITISPCISKLFEMCILQKFEHMLTVSPLQFGLKKCHVVMQFMHCVLSLITIPRVHQL